VIRGAAIHLEFEQQPGQLRSVLQPTQDVRAPGTEGVLSESKAGTASTLIFVKSEGDSASVLDPQFSTKISRMVAALSMLRIEAAFCGVYAFH